MTQHRHIVIENLAPVKTIAHYLLTQTSWPPGKSALGQNERASALVIDSLRSLWHW